MANDSSARFDWLVLTAANARQAEAYDRQLAQRVGRGALAGAKGAFAIPDARDARIGSGAATVLALVEVARRLLASRRRPKAARAGREETRGETRGKTRGETPGGSGVHAANSELEELLAGERVLMLHSGGDSRRLPMYAVEGKLFAPLPMPAPGARCAAVFDLLLEDLAQIEPRAGGEVLVGAGDAVIGFCRSDARLRFHGDGVVGVAQRAPLARAARHGVFVAPDRGGIVADFLQKPAVDTMHARGAVLPDGRALLDLGLFSFDPASAAALLAGAGVSLRAGKLAIARGGLADLASRGEVPPVDLYRELAMALPANARRDAYLAACGGGDARLAVALGGVFDAMRGQRFAVEIADVGDFLHIGTMREMLQALCGPRARVAGFGVATLSYPLAVYATAKPVEATEISTLDSDLARVDRGSGAAVIDASAIGRLEFGGDNMVMGLDAERLSIPKGVACFALALGRGVATVACGVDDDFKTRLDAGGTLFGRDFHEFLAKSGLDAAQVVEGDGTLWDARLWTISTRRDGAGVAWMWRGERAPRGFARARRLSMRELLSASDGARAAEWRASAARRARLRDPVVSFNVDAVAGDLGELHRAILAAPKAERAALLAAVGTKPLDGFPSHRVRAHAAATLSCAVADLGAKGAALARNLRAQAFSAVGDGVLAQCALPSAPERAAILHDQAVWTSTPVRVDLAGGWTDTPPICSAVGGSVVNVAVALRGQLPIQVVAKLEEEPVIRITSTDLGETRVIRATKDLAQRGDPTRWSSLAENALVLTGAAPSDPRAPLSKWLARVGGGISLTMFSAVPKGSGLGTSSILGAATIQCLDRVFGRERAPGALFAATSALEQMLSTRGGWQDQVGGVLGGFKIARTDPGSEQVPDAEALAVPPRLAAELRARSILYFTGERRMAKNILETVVWNWLTHEPSAKAAVEGLHSNAERMRAALLRGDGDGFAAEIGEYMRLKRLIDPGCCPAAFDALATRWSRELSSWSFAGAGGGGFMLLVARDASRADAIRASIERDRPHPRARAFDFEVDPAGLRCAVL